MKPMASSEKGAHGFASVVECGQQKCDERRREHTDVEEKGSESRCGIVRRLPGG